eukprot:CAMPEP_0115842282 /NCGR_PEP_ID=MMETSP0287-20121206/7720_1 /TAXON_ID=412157 /ORGANISM="Chrysochromulina rotalis, Strain UIO044" /LENGTH=88 /DNA_ID=CAMNT_0003295947 /DNA_START=743 /DNA_END=1009 /DNA_ORIENTATION=-
MTATCEGISAAKEGWRDALIGTTLQCWREATACIHRHEPLTITQRRRRTKLGHGEVKQMLAAVLCGECGHLMGMCLVSDPISTNLRDH